MPNGTMHECKNLASETDSVSKPRQALRHPVKHIVLLRRPINYYQLVNLQYTPDALS